MSFWTRLVDTITPWDRQGEVQRRQERKRREDETRVATSGGNNVPQVQRPQNVFDEPLRQENAYTKVFNQPLTTRQVAPTPQVQEYDAQALDDAIPKPKQSLLNKVRDQFDANTEADKYRRAVRDFKETNANMRARGVPKQKAQEEATRFAKSQMNVPYQSKLDFTRDAVRDVGYDFIGRPVKMLGSVPIEATRSTIADATGNRAAREAAERRLEENLFRREGAEKIERGERLGGWDLVGSLGDAISVLPIGKAGSMVTRGAKTALAERSLNPLIRGTAAGLDEALLGIRNLFRRPNQVIEQADDIGNVLNPQEIDDIIGSTNIPVRENPSDLVNDVLGPVDNSVNVRNVTNDRPLIQELGGDAPTVNVAEAARQARADAARRAAFEESINVRPDRAIEGVTPRVPEKPFSLDDATVKSGQDKVIQDYADYLRSIGEGNGTGLVPVTEGGLDMGYRRVSNNVRFGDTKGKRMTKADWLDEAQRQIESGQADPEIIKAYRDASNPEIQSLLNEGEPVRAGVERPINVQKVDSINVKDESVVPIDTPATPGRVRVTESAAPMQAKTKAVAAQTPPALPKETQAILDNPKQFNKRQVAAARNQRKLARQMAKTQEDTAEAISRIDNANVKRVEGQPEGFAPTGEFRKGKRGNVYERANRELEAQTGRSEMANRSVDDLLDEVSAKGSLSPGDKRRISAAKENLMKSDPENFRSSDRYKLLDRLEKSGRSQTGAELALIPRTIRKSANATELTGRWERKVANILDDPSKMSDAQWGQVQRANEKFTVARDNAAALEEKFRRTGSEADFKAWEDAFREARNADVSAKMAEIKVAQDVLKGEKGAGVTKLIDDLKKEADVNTMDFISANMLSGTGTGFRNTFGTELMGVENRLFANTRAKITNKLFKENVGGFDRQGAKYGRKVGVGKWYEDINRRASAGGNNLIEWAKNWSTTINSAGESSLQSQVYSRLGKYYKNQFEAAGSTGKALDLKMRHAMLTDPDNMADIYLDGAMKSSGLTGMFEKSQTIEKAITDWVGRGIDNKYAQGASKLIMRIAVGFPTATGNFLYQSGKRLTLGLPSFLETGAKLAKGDKASAAMAFERALKEAGSGTAMLGLGAALGKAGVVSGPYPDDKDERARWEREGISENSIKIGGNWYPIPQGAGMLGLPIMVGAAIGSEGDSNDAVKRFLSPKNLAKLLPTDQLQSTLNMITGDESPQALKNMVASGVRAVTPVGALFNQIAKSLDQTKNDTTTKGFWNNVFDQVLSGIPGVNNMAGIPDKTDKEGNVIQNPNAAALAFGATSASQEGGEQRSQEIQGKINSQLAGVDQYGLLQDKNLDGVLEGKALEAFTKAQSGKQLDESDIKSLREGLVKGVSQEGGETAYLEREQYDTNLAVLKLKRDLMKEDPTVKRSSMENIDEAIKRGEIYKNNKTPYSLIQDYKEISLTDWRKLEDEDPELYQKLWDLDQQMAEEGVARGKRGKAKYYAKASGVRGGRKGRSYTMATDFGTFQSPTTPKVKAYESIDVQSGSVPRIKRVRPNIVHKVGVSS